MRFLVLALLCALCGGAPSIFAQQSVDLASVVPGVSPTNVASTQLFPETSAVPGVTLSVARVSRIFPLGRVQPEALVEGFNLTNHQNVLTRNGNFGPGAYPSNPSATFGQITAVGEPRSFQFGARVRF